MRDFIRWLTTMLLLALALMMILYMMASGVASLFLEDKTPAPDPTPVQGRAAWDDMDAAQPSWVIEGIQERMSELEDDLHYAVHLQEEKLAARPPPG